MKNKTIANGARIDRPFQSPGTNDDEEGLNPFYLKTFLPPCTRCSFCDEEMTKMRLTGVVMTEMQAINPAAHMNYVCRNRDCDKIANLDLMIAILIRDDLKCQG